MKITNPLKDPICVFREGDNEDNCADCARIKQTTIPKGHQSWQYVPKVAKGEKCPSFVKVQNEG